MEKPHTPVPAGALAFTSLMEEALRCPCDAGDIPLCGRCECLFLLAVAAADYAFHQTWRPRERTPPPPWSREEDAHG